MYKICCFILLFFNNLLAFQASAQVADTIVVQGDVRTFDLYLPTGYNPAQRYPLVVSMHPGLSNAINHANGSQWHILGNTAGFITVYPNGMRTAPNANGRLWNAYEQPSSVADVDDTGFLNQMLDRLIQRYAIDTCRVYLSGFSNGAMMAYRMACDFTRRFAAIAPLSGGWGYGSDGLCGDDNCNGDPASPACDWKMAYVNCQPSKKIPLIFMKGSQEQDNLPTCRGTVDSLNKIYWSSFLNCVNRQLDTIVVANKTVFRERFTDCDDDTEFHFLTVLGNGHVWHQPATELFWAFLKTKSACTPTLNAQTASESNILSLSPNPATSTLLFNFKGSSRAYTIFDTAGRLIHQGKLLPKELNVSTLPSGIYFLHVQLENGGQIIQKWAKW
jgi:polyhydroxybutyrate depolymerase